jgi:hypothetical protein
LLCVGTAFVVTTRRRALARDRATN